MNKADIVKMIEQYIYIEKECSNDSDDCCLSMLEEMLGEKEQKGFLSYCSDMCKQYFADLGCKNPEKYIVKTAERRSGCGFCSSNNPDLKNRIELLNSLKREIFHGSLAVE